MVAWASSTRRGKIIRMLVQDQQEWPLWRMPMAVSGCFRPVGVGVLGYSQTRKNSNRICPCALSPRLAHITVQELPILLADSINSWSLCGVFFFSACDSRMLLMPWHVRTPMEPVKWPVKKHDECTCTNFLSLSPTVNSSRQKSDLTIIRCPSSCLLILSHKPALATFGVHTGLASHIQSHLRHQQTLNSAWGSTRR